MEFALKEPDFSFKDIAALQAATPTERKNLSIWELEDSLKCPVVGTCMSIEDHKKVLNKAGCSPKGLAPYEIHRLLMGQLAKKNAVSTKTDNFLKFKYRTALKKYAKLDEPEFLQKWKQAVENGNLDELLYVAAVRPNLDTGILDTIAGEVHVLGHVNISLAQKNGQQLKLEKSIVSKLKEEIEILRKKNRDLQKENKNVNKEITNLKYMYESSQKKLLVLTENNSGKIRQESDNKTLEAKYQQLESTNQALLLQNKKQDKTIKVAQSKIDEMHEHNQLLKRELENSWIS